MVPISDQNGGSGIRWGLTTATTDATNITDGAQNTDDIVDCLSVTSGGGCPGNINKSTYAAGICDDLSIAGGYANGPGNRLWFLPAGNNTGTSGQIFCLYTNRVTINTAAQAAGGTNLSSIYWSSTESSSSAAWRQVFSTGAQAAVNKGITNYRVRCARAIIPSTP